MKSVQTSSRQNQNESQTIKELVKLMNNKKLQFRPNPEVKSDAL